MPLILQDTPIETATSGIVELNAFEVGAAASGALLATQALAVLGSLAPAYVTLMGGTTGAMAYVGYRRRHDLPLIPSFKKANGEDMTAEEIKEDITKTMSAIADEVKGKVTDHSGNAVAIEGL